MLRSGDEIGPYTLISKLGKGAFGVVWLAERRTQITTTTAAIKIPLDEDISIENLLLGKHSGESQSSFRRWLEKRETLEVTSSCA